MKFRLLALLAVAMLIATSPAWAFDVTWQFATSTMNGNYGTSQSFTGSDASTMVTAYGYQTPSTATDLYGKYTAGDPIETGLGIATPTPLLSPNSFEIGTGNFIQFDVSSLLSGFTGGSFTIGSLQTGESFMLCGSNSLGTLGTGPDCTAAIFESGSGTSVNTVSLMNWGSFDFYSIAGVAGDVLIDNLTLTPVNPVPEPISMLLLGSGLLGLGFLRRRFGSSA